MSTTSGLRDAHPDLYARQILLVGASGQLAIQRSIATVDLEGDALAIAIIYGERAGLQAVEVGAAAPRTGDAADAFVSASAGARAVLEGSRAILRELVRASGSGASP